MTAFSVKKAIPVISTLFALSACLLGAPDTRAAPPSDPDWPFNAKTFGRTFTHRFTTVNGVRLHYVIGGKGDLVVLLHGYPETWYDWRKVMPGLAAHYTVVAPDMRGLGESSIPADGDYTKKTVADDIYKLVRSLGRKRVFLVAQDMGGPVAISYAGAHPGDVPALVFIESGIPGYGLEKAMDPSQGGMWHFGFFAAPKFPEMLTRGREREFLTAFAFRSHFVYQKTAFTDADISEYVRRYTKPGGMTAGFGYYRAFAQDAKDSQKMFAKTKLTLPILAIGGAHGLKATSKENVERLDANVTGLIFSDAGHFVNEERPGELNKAVLAFFAGK
ncbi:epoxide hydrolase [Capsulimonas corticalis]|uniref:Epoxide hydrolase n=1 Tax=Capsulimonas corticalis TaxID=2219043 RepID=A0A402D448_9BACT|nr:alpha/beta hydrolase [Capsulimonas corticalis]BDI31188.1 epoxide hydrolase [Capsulimonas corticalis]